MDSCWIAKPFSTLATGRHTVKVIRSTKSGRPGPDDSDYDVFQFEIGPVEVSLASDARNPIPVIVVPQRTNGDMITIIDNAAAPSGSTCLVDVKGYRSVSILGRNQITKSAILYGNFIDTGSPNPDYLMGNRTPAGYCLLTENGSECMSLPFAVAGPYLELGISNDNVLSPGAATIKAYFQKSWQNIRST